MSNLNSNISKRQSFRQQIRRKQIQKMFDEKRKHYQQNQEESKTSWQYSLNPANNILVNRSLIKNELVAQLPILVPSLRQKLLNNCKVYNIQFVISICSNILRDDITLDWKEIIYDLCIQALKLANNLHISPLVQVYLYQSVLFACYQCLDQDEQVRIEKKMLPRLIQLLGINAIDMSRVPSRYSQLECRLQIQEGVCNSLYYFLYPDNDHNNTLLYKLRRNTEIVSKYIQWFENKFSSGKVQQEYTNIKSIKETTVMTLYNIIKVPADMRQLFPHDTVERVSSIALNMLEQYSQDYEKAKTYCCFIICSLLNHQTQVLQVDERVLKLIVAELQRSVEQVYKEGLISVLAVIVDKFQLQGNSRLDRDTISNMLCYLLTVLKDILSGEQQRTQSELMVSCLKLMRSILNKGFEWGCSQYSHYLSSIGAMRLMDQLYVKIRDKSVLELLEDIYNLVQLC